MGSPDLEDLATSRLQLCKRAEVVRFEVVRIFVARGSPTRPDC
jgi:hypothetical protein